VVDRYVAAVQEWIAENYARTAPVASMIKMRRLPERSVKLRFTHAPEMTPLEYVHTLRLEEAKQLLEITDMPIDAVANEVGVRGRQLLPPAVPTACEGIELGPVQAGPALKTWSKIWKHGLASRRKAESSLVRCLHTVLNRDSS